jgi:DNA polymerase IV (DinB-like DNA polymerase)
VTAKRASDHDTPDRPVDVRPGEVRGFLAPLDVEELHGIGPVTARSLREHGVETVGDLADRDVTEMEEAHGERGRELVRRARGVDDREVTPAGLPKSLSRESSFAEATTHAERKREQVRRLAAAVADRARRKGALYRTIGIKAVETPYDVNTRERSLPGPVDEPELVEEVALELLSEFADDRVRKLGVRLSNLDFSGTEQRSLTELDDGGSPETGGTGEAAVTREAADNRADADATDAAESGGGGGGEPGSSGEVDWSGDGGSSRHGGGSDEAVRPGGSTGSVDAGEPDDDADSADDAAGRDGGSTGDGDRTVGRTTLDDW